MNDQNIFPLDIFENEEFDMLECGNDTSFVIYNKSQEYVPQCVHEGYTCEITQQSPIIGTMHFWNDVSYTPS